MCVIQEKEIMDISEKDLYKNAIDILTSQGKFYINLGLERIRAVLEILGNPQNKLKFIHVAGTNGKGSVCSILSSILVQSGYKIGLFTSPHVFEYTERIKINNIEIEKETFAQNVINIVELAQKNNIHLTEFEILTAVAFDYFAQNNVDIVVLETGLGGRLDATNIIEENLCSIITHIDFDHTERLGETLEKIAFEKAGIIKENCPVVVSPKNSGFNIIEEVAALKKAQISFPAESPLSNLIEINALKGIYQKENLSLVLAAIDELNKKGFDIPQQAIQAGLQKVKHPCRFEYLKDKNILIDGAHNPNGTKVLRESLDKFFQRGSYTFIFGCLKNKDYPQMMKNLFTSQDRIFFYEFENNNACTYEELAAACEFDSRPFSEFKKEEGSLIVVCGSLYMIRELMPKISEK